MVSVDLAEVYEKLIKKKELYERATRVSNVIITFGALVFFLTCIPIIPLILGYFLKIDLHHSYLGGLSCGVILAIVGGKLKKRSPLPPSLSPEEKEFIKIFDALKNLDTYFEDEKEFEFAKFEAAKILSKIERDLYKPSNSDRLWDALTKEIDEKLKLLKHNLREKLIPTLRKGGKDEVRKVYPILENLARYFLEPSTFKLDDVNRLMLELPAYKEEKESVTPFFERYPYSRHVIAFSLILIIGGITFLLGISFLNISIESAYIAATTITGTLSAGYLTKVKRV